MKIKKTFFKICEKIKRIKFSKSQIIIILFVLLGILGAQLRYADTAVPVSLRKNVKKVLARVDSRFVEEKNGTQPQHSKLVTSNDTPKQIQAPRLFLSGGKEGHLGGGVISLSSTSEPVIQIYGYQVSGEAEVSFYKANQEALLQYLTYDENGKQLKSEPDPTSFEFVTKVNQKISSDYQNGEDFLLPIEDSGIYFLQVKYGDLTENAFVIRSTNAMLLEEGNNEYIFWGQDFQTQRSISEGKLVIYNLRDLPSIIQEVDFSSEGIALANTSEKADVAFLQNGTDLALVPINLQYLNSDYEYNEFLPKAENTKFFLFTDRPLYKPGDTVFFKSIVREDDDAQYSLPTGTARVKLFEGYSENNLLFEKTYAISDDGTISGEYTLPTQVGPGTFRLQIETTEERAQENFWSYSNRDYAYFDVSYYRKPDFNIEVSTEKDELRAGDHSTFTIQGEYFYGQPVTQTSVRYRVYASDFYESDFLAYFRKSLESDYHYGTWGGETVVEGEVTLNDNGQATVEFNANIPESHKGRTQIFSIEAELLDDAGNPSYSRKNILVRAGDFGIFRSDTWSRVVKGESLSLPVILVSPDQASISSVNLTAAIKRNAWRWKGHGKSGSYIKEEETYPELKVTTDEAGRAVINFIPEKAGLYTITVQGNDSGGRLISKDFSVYVSSSDRGYYYNSSGNSLGILLDKEKYELGDNAKLLITSDIPDRDIFLSTQRNYVHSYQIIHVDGTEATVELPLAQADIPNIFAHVASFSGSGLDTRSENIVVNSESKHLNVTLAPEETTVGPGDTITVNILASDNLGQPISADLAVWAVDKSLYELAADNTGDVFKDFWRERYNNTQISHSLRGIYVLDGGKGGCFASGTPVLMADGSTKNIEDVKTGDIVLTKSSDQASELVSATVSGTHSVETNGLLIINGDLQITPNHILWVNDSWQSAGSIQIGDQLLDKNNNSISVTSVEWSGNKSKVYNLSIEKYHSFFAGGVWVHNDKDGGVRSVFKDTAYWNPSVHTDANGKARVRFEIPDNLTTWVIVGLGSTDDTIVGQGTTEVVVSKHVVVRPVVPNILRVGDQAVLSAVVQNFTDSEQTFDIDLEFNSGEVVEPKRSGIIIPAKGSEQLYWEVKPTNENEKATLTFSAVSEAASDTLEYTLPVYKFGFNEQTAQVGSGEVTHSVVLEKDIDPEKSSVMLSLSPTLVGSLPTAMKYLLNYPYGCVEQTTSRFVPAVIAKANPELFSEALDGKNVDEIIEKSLIRLAMLQNSDGGWSWWGVSVSDPFVTAYVVEYLIEAEKVGVDVNDSMLSKAKNFLENEVDGEIREDRISRMYGLMLMGEIDPNIRLTDLKALEPHFLALAVMVNYTQGDKNPKSNGLEELQNMAQTQGDSLFWKSGDKKYYGSIDASTALAIRAIVTAGGDSSFAEKGLRYLSRSRQTEYWANTFGTAQTIRAFVDLANIGYESSPNYTYTVSIDDEILSQGSVTSTTDSIEDIEIPLNKIKSDGSSLRVEKEGKGQIYSTVLISQFHQDVASAEKSHGLSVQRKYINQNGEENLSVGDKVTVELTLSGLNAPERYGVIEDVLPAGLVPINQSFENETFDRAKKSWFDWHGVSNREITENGVILSLYNLDIGTKTYTYTARVVTEGTFLVPPATASLMYAPEVYGRSAAQTVIISGKE